MRPITLVVDDDATTLAALLDLLSCKLPRLRVETTTDVVDALARLDVQRYSAVLTDLRMPRTDGLTFLQEVKRRQADTPVVLMTGISDAALAVLAIDAGAFDFLPKPLDRDDIATTIQLAVTVSRLLRDIEASQRRLRRYADRLRRLQGSVPPDGSDVMEWVSGVIAGVGVVQERVRESASIFQSLLVGEQSPQCGQERVVRCMLLG